MSLKEYVALLPTLDKDTIYTSILIFVVVSIFKLLQKTIILDMNKCDRQADKAIKKIVDLIKLLDNPVLDYSKFYEAYLFVDIKERKELKAYIDNHEKEKIGDFLYKKLADYDCYISKLGEDDLVDPFNFVKVNQKLKIKEKILYPLFYTFIAFIVIILILVVYAISAKYGPLEWLRFLNILCAFIWTIAIIIYLFKYDKFFLSSVFILLIGIFNISIFLVYGYIPYFCDVLLFISNVSLVLICVKTKSACNLKDVTRKMNFKFYTIPKNIIKDFVTEQNASLINKKEVRTFAYLYDGNVCAVFQAVKKEENIVLKNVITNEIFEDIKKENNTAICKIMKSYFKK